MPPNDRRRTNSPSQPSQVVRMPIERSVGTVLRKACMLISPTGARPRQDVYCDQVVGSYRFFGPCKFRRSNNFKAFLQNIFSLSCSLRLVLASMYRRVSSKK